MTRGPVLMSPANPEGWKLEDLLERLRTEIREKSAKIASDPREVARLVYRNNQRILELLLEAERLQRESYAALDALAPNQGPLGIPRIGVGSVALETGFAQDRDLGDERESA